MFCYPLPMVNVSIGTEHSMISSCAATWADAMMALWFSVRFCMTAIVLYRTLGDLGVIQKRHGVIPRALEMSLHAAMTCVSPLWNISCQAAYLASTMSGAKRI